MDKKRRQRGKHFSEQEKELLIDLVSPFKTTIENIKTDAVWNQRKNEAWQEITNMYNVEQTTGVRNDAQLKHLYDTLKREARKESSKDKVELYKTGGGTKRSTMSSTTQKVIGLLGDRMEPLHNVVDCDAHYNNGQDKISCDDIIIEEVSEEEIYLHNTIELNNAQQNISSENSYLNDSAPKSSNSTSYHNPLTLTNQFKPTEENNSLKSKTETVRNIYKGLADLNKERLEKTLKTKQIKDELYEVKLKKAKFKLETSELKKNLMAKRIRYETDMMESEVRQNNIKEQILLLELQHKKKC